MEIAANRGTGTASRCTAWLAGGTRSGAVTVSIVRSVYIVAVLTTDSHGVCCADE